MTDSIFFDFDGVIMDSMALKLDSYAHALRRFVPHTRTPTTQQAVFHSVRC